MREVTAGRTLVKSPPELWAVCSDADSLARHLEAFGEIRITRLEPETTVAWEGERASGTVRIEPSGWGTKVTVTAAQRPPAVTPELTVTAPNLEAVTPEASTLEASTPEAPVPVVPGPDAPALEAEPGRTESEPVKRPGFFARLFGSGRRPAAPAARSEPAAVVAAVTEPPAVAAVTEPAAVAAAPGSQVASRSEPVAARPGPVDAVAALEAALDSLGQAHRRPFSR